MDIFSADKRSEIMRKIKSKDTKIEIEFRKLLWQKGIRFRKNVLKMKGKPDIIISKNKIIIFLDSCFWHCCPNHFKMPKSNTLYWNRKIEYNKQRDSKINAYYKEFGWHVLRFWEHELQKNSIYASLLKVEETILKTNIKLKRNPS